MVWWFNRVGVELFGGQLEIIDCWRISSEGYFCCNSLAPFLKIGKWRVELRFDACSSILKSPKFENIWRQKKAVLHTEANYLFISYIFTFNKIFNNCFPEKILSNA
jgi:hypothetical protein